MPGDKKQFVNFYFSFNGREASRLTFLRKQKDPDRIYAIEASSAQHLFN
jgi:hypothetical protein